MLIVLARYLPLKIPAYAQVLDTEHSDSVSFAQICWELKKLVPKTTFIQLACYFRLSELPKLHTSSESFVANITVVWSLSRRF